MGPFGRTAVTNENQACAGGVDDCAGSRVTWWVRVTVLSCFLAWIRHWWGYNKRKIVPRSGLGTKAGILGRPKEKTKPSCSQVAEIPFKEL